MNTPNTPVPIAYAEDDPDDQLSFTEIINMLPFPVEPYLFTDGLSLFQFLQEAEAAHTLPRCIILDVNMPIWDGIKTLQTIRADGKYQAIPVIMLTTSLSPIEKNRCLELGATAFFTKPVNRVDFQQVATELMKLIA
jgi:CheY-like chemotaxis protein